MKLMKKTLVLLCIVGLSGCAGLGVPKQAFDDWTGATMDEVLVTYGVPARQISLSSGGMLVEFYNDFSLSIGGNRHEYYCTVRFQFDHLGSVISKSQDGNLGGCNRLFKYRPSN